MQCHFDQKQTEIGSALCKYLVVGSQDAHLSKWNAERIFANWTNGDLNERGLLMNYSYMCKSIEMIDFFRDASVSEAVRWRFLKHCD